MFYAYIFIAAVLLPILDRCGVNIFHNANSWWLSPLLLVAFFFGFVLLHLGIAALSIAIINVNSTSEKGNRYYRALVKHTLPLLIKFGRMRIHSTGTENVPTDKRFLLVCNHTHDIDPAVIMSVLPDSELGFIAKKEVYTEHKFVAKIMRKLYCLPIDRENNRKAVETIVKSVNILKEDKASIAVFPEGYTSLDGRLHDFRNGVFKIACKANVPIVVCTLVGVRKSVKKLFKHKSDVYFDVVDVVSAEDVSQMNTAQIGERVHLAMEKSLEKHNATVQEI